MGYTNSPLATDSVDFHGKNCNQRKNATYNPSGAITVITPHHMAIVNISGKQCAQGHANGNASSANYYIGVSGDICLGIPESCRAQTSSSPNNDYNAITIEVANSNGKPNQEISDASWNSLVKLCVDICKRNGIKQLNYTGDKNGNLTRHNMFAATECPGSYLQGRFPELAQKVNAQLSTTPTPTPSPKSDEEKIWDYFMSKIGNAYGVAGLMGNLYAESGLRSNNLQNTFEKKLGMSDDQYTAAVDNGTYTNFVRDSAGYGLAQWTFWSRKQNLLNYCNKCGTSIGNLDMQLDFLGDIELPGYKTVWATLKTATSVREASDIVLTQFEKPANQSEAVKQQRAKYGQVYYDKYAGTTPTPAPAPTPTCPYMVRVTVSALNIRSGPGTQYPVVGSIDGGGVFTIIEQKNNWGLLKSKQGWICLDYTTLY